MNDKEHEKAARLYRLLTGRGAEDDAFERIAAVSSGFAEFRVRLTLDAELVPQARQVVARWVEVVRNEITHRPLGEALHNIEQLSIKYSQLERTINDLGAKLLDQMRQLDAATESLSGAHREAAELRRLLSRYREIVVRLGDQIETRKESARA